MMPTIEITEDTFRGLQLLAQPLVDTADSVIARLVEEALRTRGSSDPVKAAATDELGPDDALDLSFTKVLQASVDGQRVKKANWNRVVRKAHEAAFRKVRSFQALKDITRANIVEGEPGPELVGYTYVESGNFALQGMDANQAWRAIRDLAGQLDIPVAVEFEWRDKDDVATENRGRKARLSSLRKEVGA